MPFKKKEKKEKKIIIIENKIKNETHLCSSVDNWYYHL